MSNMNKILPFKIIKQKINREDITKNIFSFLNNKITIRKEYAEFEERNSKKKYQLYKIGLKKLEKYIVTTKTEHGDITNVYLDNSSYDRRFNNGYGVHYVEIQKFSKRHINDLIKDKLHVNFYCEHEDNISGYITSRTRTGNLNKDTLKINNKDYNIRNLFKNKCEIVLNTSFSNYLEYKWIHVYDKDPATYVENYEWKKSFDDAIPYSKVIKYIPYKSKKTFVKIPKVIIEDVGFLSD